MGLVRLLVPETVPLEKACRGVDGKVHDAKLRHLFGKKEDPVDPRTLGAMAVLCNLDDLLRDDFADVVGVGTVRNEEIGLFRRGPVDDDGALSKEVVVPVPLVQGIQDGLLVVLGNEIGDAGAITGRFKSKAWGRSFGRPVVVDHEMVERTVMLFEQGFLPGLEGKGKIPHQLIIGKNPCHGNLR